MKRMIVFILFVFVVLTISGCAGTLKDYEAGSQDEEAIKSLLLYWQTSGNKGDVAGVLSVLTDDFQIYHNWPSNKAQVESKKEYGASLPEKMKRNPTVIVGLPEITVTGDKAIVRAPLDTTRGRLKATFYLERQNEKWLIMRLEWYQIQSSQRR